MNIKKSVFFHNTSPVVARLPICVLDSQFGFLSLCRLEIFNKKVKSVKLIIGLSVFTRKTCRCNLILFRFEKLLLKIRTTNISRLQTLHNLNKMPKSLTLTDTL